MTSAWREMATDGFAAAGELVAGKRWRSAVSRAYYAAYARVVAELADGGLEFGSRGNPGHASVPRMILNNMPTLQSNARANMASAMDSLYKMRLVADYRADALVDDADARGSAAMMAQVFRRLKEVGSR